jgi:hypothetical protein
MRRVTTSPTLRRREPEKSGPPVDHEAVAAFLHFGYLPPGDEGPPRVLQQVLDGLAGGLEGGGSTDDSPVKSGGRVLRSCFEPPDGRLQVVPLSGGLDSRAVLAGLIAAGARKDIMAVTIGTPGTFDFDIARQVATRAGVAHEAIDLTKVPLDPDALERALMDSDATGWAFDVFFHRLIPGRFGREATYWSGFMGGELAGAHVPAEPFPSWPAAVGHFATHAAFCPGAGLTPAGFDPARVLPARPWCEPEVLSFTDQLDFGVRQASYVCPTVVVGGYDYRTPFMSPPWLRFMLAVPAERRRGERLFKQILMDTFPDLFSLPAKNTAGLRVGAPASLVKTRVRLMKAGELLRSGSIARAVRERRPLVPFRMLNYLDFSATLGARPEVRAAVAGLIRDLEARGAVDWLGAGRLWEGAGPGPSGPFRAGDADRACALTLLASLELNLRVDGARPRPRFGQPR